jgi:diaminohydroxyphosphoribosylaminopyrimidine deaminase / 5-amino-6-(5-phosphoribosylamino)uracil reductase
MPATHPEDILFMQRCLQLAALGELHTAPNPMVGAVIVHDGRIIGEGWHRKYGEEHAEVRAFNNVKAEDLPLLTDSTLYVSLEPCSHHGKTPPCTDLILRKKIPVVVIGCRDENPLVGGMGIARLKAHGVEVRQNVLEHECLELNRKFFLAHRLKRPYITLKWAQTSDGYVSHKDGSPMKISGDSINRFSHRLRANHMAILCGANTVLKDRPQLNNRHWEGPQPQVIIWDWKGRLNHDEYFLKRTDWWRICPDAHVKREHDLSSQSENFQDILEMLYANGISSILVEGGPATHQQFIAAGLWDEAIIYTAAFAAGDGISAVAIEGRQTEKFAFGTDFIQIYRPE